jgi:hypothetical protein
MKPLDKFAAMSLIKSCGVDRVFRLEKNHPGTKATYKRIRCAALLLNGFFKEKKKIYFW